MAFTGARLVPAHSAECFIGYPGAAHIETGLHQDSRRWPELRWPGFAASGPGMGRDDQLSEEKYCSVGIMIGKTAQIKTRIEIENLENEGENHGENINA
jgi:hypothetical protein